MTNGETEGEWGPVELCPDGSKAIGYQSRNDLNIGLDHTSLNSIRLFCDDGVSNITSTEGWTGQWSNRKDCEVGAALSAFQLRVQPNGNTTDDTAANSIRFRCTDGLELTSAGNPQGSFGDYSEACTTGICGLKTLMKPQGGIIVDNTALNDVVFECCP